MESGGLNPINGVSRISRISRRQPSLYHHQMKAYHSLNLPVEQHENCWTLMVPLDTNLMEVLEWPITTRGLQWVLR